VSVVHVAFLWHQHQPFYKDLVSGEYALPWVRLHAIKDYVGMPLLAEAVEGMRITINLVPSLVAQVADYAAGGGCDRWLDVCRLPADSLEEDDALFILDNFFAANRQTMIDVHPRYRDLHRRRAFARRSADGALPDFNVQDLRDLQVWSILAWFHPLAVERHEPLKALTAKGEGFTEDDKAAMLEVQQAVLAAVVPLHRRLADAGVLELTTSPYYHPILPLLVGMESAREAMPDVALPSERTSVVEDARAHLEKAVALHTEAFGRPPRGMWPSEGSVSDGIIPLVEAAGIRWVASDEEVLAQSLGRPLRREVTGSVRADADRLYRAYRVANDGSEIQIIFRDHVLSDLIGFQYRDGDQAAAADDFVGRLVEIGRHAAGDDCLVPVILDGENAWEHYPNQGVEFLRALYERVVAAPEVEPVLVSDFLEAHPPTERLPRLAAGSWINHNFAIWVGHEEDNRAWNCVFAARAFLEARTAEAPQAARRQPPLETAWEELYIAEGSDWYWWYGDEHSSGQDEVFDLLFRTHLKNVYTLLDESSPPALDVPVIGAAKVTAYSRPKSFLDVVVEGRDSNYFEWLDAGHYAAANRYGAMRRSAARRVTDLYYGFNEETFFLKLCAHGTLREVLGPAPTATLIFREPREVTVRIAWSNGAPPTISAASAGSSSSAASAGSSSSAASAGSSSSAPDADETPIEPTGIRVALDHTLEVAVPFAFLGGAPGDPVHFAVEVGDAEAFTERIPDAGSIAFAAPSADFEQINWQA